MDKVKPDRLLIRPSEAAQMFAVSRSKIYELIASGAVPSVRIGGMWRIPMDAARKLAEVKTEETD
jgi:excisionase family DNA binding protein